MCPDLSSLSPASSTVPAAAEDPLEGPSWMYNSPDSSGASRKTISRSVSKTYSSSIRQKNSSGHFYSDNLGSIVPEPNSSSQEESDDDRLEINNGQKLSESSPKYLKKGDEKLGVKKHVSAMSKFSQEADPLIDYEYRRRYKNSSSIHQRSSGDIPARTSGHSLAEDADADLRLYHEGSFSSDEIETRETKSVSVGSIDSSKGAATAVFNVNDDYDDLPDIEFPSKPGDLTLVNPLNDTWSSPQLQLKRFEALEKRGGRNRSKSKSNGRGSLKHETVVEIHQLHASPSALMPPPTEIFQHKNARSRKSRKSFQTSVAQVTKAINSIVVSVNGSTSGTTNNGASFEEDDASVDSSDWSKARSRKSGKGIQTSAQASKNNNSIVSVKYSYSGTSENNASLEDEDSPRDSVDCDDRGAIGAITTSAPPSQASVNDNYLLPDFNETCLVNKSMEITLQSPSRINKTRINCTKQAVKHSEVDEIVQSAGKNSKRKIYKTTTSNDLTENDFSNKFFHPSKSFPKSAPLSRSKKGVDTERTEYDLTLMEETVMQVLPYESSKIIKENHPSTSALVDAVRPETPKQLSIILEDCLKGRSSIELNEHDLETVPASVRLSPASSTKSPCRFLNFRTKNKCQKTETDLNPEKSSSLEISNSSCNGSISNFTIENFSAMRKGNATLRSNTIKDSCEIRATSKENEIVSVPLSPVENLSRELDDRGSAIANCKQTTAPLNCSPGSSVDAVSDSNDLIDIANGEKVQGRRSHSKLENLKSTTNILSSASSKAVPSSRASKQSHCISRLNLSLQDGDLLLTYNSSTDMDNEDYSTPLDEIICEDTSTNTAEGNTNYKRVSFNDTLEISASTDESDKSIDLPFAKRTRNRVNRIESVDESIRNKEAENAEVEPDTGLREEFIVVQPLQIEKRKSILKLPSISPSALCETKIGSNETKESDVLRCSSNSSHQTSPINDVSQVLFLDETFDDSIDCSKFETKKRKRTQDMVKVTKSRQSPTKTKKNSVFAKSNTQDVVLSEMTLKNCKTKGNKIVYNDKQTGTNPTAVEADLFTFSCGKQTGAESNSQRPAVSSGFPSTKDTNALDAVNGDEAVTHGADYSLVADNTAAATDAAVTVTSAVAHHADATKSCGLGHPRRAASKVISYTEPKIGRLVNQINSTPLDGVN